MNKQVHRSKADGKSWLKTNSKSSLKRMAVFLFAVSITASFSAMAKENLYTKGQQLLDDGKWAAAETTFKKLVANNGKKRDAGLYWLAYSQFKNNQHQAALTTIARLSKDFPNSNWLDDAKALKVEIADSRGEPLEIDDDELKLYAINSLMNSSSKKAVPLLSKIILGNGSDKIKKRALFVLSQSNKPEAYELIAKLAMDDSDVSIQKYAVHTLAISGSQKAIPLLEKVYSTTTSKEIKMLVIHGFMVSNTSDELLRIARNEKDIELKSNAIKTIGILGKSERLLKMYREKMFADYREQIIRGIAIGGGAEQLFNIIDSEKNELFLIKAIESSGILGKHKSSEKLTKLYQQRNVKAVRFAIIKALFMQSNARELINLLKQEKDPNLKRKILKSLSIMGSDESDEYFARILNAEG